MYGGGFSLTRGGRGERVWDVLAAIRGGTPLLLVVRSQVERRREERAGVGAGEGGRGEHRAGG